MIKKVLLLLFLVSCSSIPKGNRQLGKMIKEDKSTNYESTPEDIHQGRPVFIKATVWPQVLHGGDISSKGSILIMVGREKFSIETILKEQKEK